MATLILRYMQIIDIPQVVAIDNVSFDPAWSARSYAYEIGESSYSHMVVLERIVEQPMPRWKRIFKSLSGQREAHRHIVAYGGLWNIAGEGHISTIAAHPDWRGHGFGEIVLAGMIRRALTLDAEYVVLEVRVSNAVAQNLYQKYEFKTAAVKPRYYRNNNEDAYDMRLDLTDETIIARFDQRFGHLKTRQPFTDLYTDVESPKKATKR
jgi:[ribosomal protein S18]-alanine N-acetyltransferase